MSGRDKDATWRSLALVCRERGWSKARAVYALQNGLPYRTVPPGHTIDWHNPNVTHGLNVETGDLPLILGVFGGPGVGFDTRIVSIEVQRRHRTRRRTRSTHAPSALRSSPSPDTSEDVIGSARWAADTVRRLRTENKVPAGTIKAELARLLEVECEKAARAGKVSRALKASYLEDALVKWRIWPLDPLE